MLKKLFLLFFSLAAVSQAADMAFQTPVNVSAASPIGGSISSPVLAYDIGNTNNVVSASLTNNGSDNLLTIRVSSDNGASWSQPQIISTIGQTTSNPQLVFSTNGTGICLWRQQVGTTNVIRASRTTDGGVTWDTPQTINVNAYPSSLAIDASGRAICYAYSSSNSVIFSTSNGGVSWSSPVILTTQSSYNGSVAMDGNDHAVCLFYSNGFIMATGTSDGGVSWSTPIQLSQSAGDAPSLAYDSSHNSYCGVWINNAHSMQSSTTNNVGLSWSTPLDLTAEYTYELKIAFYNGSGVCAYSTSSAHLCTTKTADGGASWSTPVSIGGDYASSLFFDSNGTGYLLFINASSNLCLSRTLNQGTSWQTPVSLSSAANSAAIAVDAPNAVCTWLINQGSNYFLQASRSLDDGITWQTASTLSSLNQNANNPIFSFDSSGNGICVWEKFNGTNTLVQAARTTDKGVSWSTPIFVSLLGENVSKVTVKCGTNGNAICAWQAGNSTYSIKVSKTNDGGLTWSTPISFSTNGVWPEIGFDSRNDMFCVIWGGYYIGSYYVYASRTSDNGASWSAPATIGSAYAGKIDFDNSGNGICAAVDTLNNIKTSTTTNGGLNWTSFVTVSSGGYTSYTNNPIQLDFGGTKQAVLVWPKQVVLVYTKQACSTTDGGVSWSTPVIISNAAANADQTGLAFENGIAIAMWKCGIGDANDYIAATRSIDGGINWSTPYNISSLGADLPQVDMIGNSAVAIWLKTDGLNNLVQATFSSNSGASWSTPVNISAPAQDALVPQLAMYSNVAENAAFTALSVWTRNNGSNNVIQSSTTNPSNNYSFSAFGKQSYRNGLFQRDIVNEISWNSLATAATYRVYSDNVLLYQGNGPYNQHGLKEKKRYTYTVVWVDGSGVENDAVNISLP